MELQDKIPTTKLERTVKLVGTGAKIGSNYLKYLAKKSITGSDEKGKLHEENAADIYDSLSNLKGSALKVAQMLSMDKNILPKAYSQKFQLSQYSVPPMSIPLVIKAFTNSMGKSPFELFDTFSTKPLAAASIGQVHLAEKDGKKLAVKIQYPGVSGSIQSDLKLVKPMANLMFGLSEKEMKKYFQEVEEKLIEETDYRLELQRGSEISKSCEEIDNLHFPKYYPEFSSDKVIVMDFLDGMHLKEFLETNPSQEIKNKIAQTLWDFYEFQLHTLKTIHADPHPGNFLFTPEGTVGVIDFGCIKVVPADFYVNYFPLLIQAVQKNPTVIEQLMHKIEILFPDDSPDVKSELSEAFLRMTTLLSRPFSGDKFQFTNEFLDEIYQVGEEIYQIPEVRKPTKPRGSKHALYVNRTYFGIYSMMADLNAEINIRSGNWKHLLLKELGI